MSAKVSIIMGVYNGEKTIATAIESILSQTYIDWVFIICDDGSTDGTKKILEKYGEEYPQKFIIIRNQTNIRLAATLNRCLEYVGTEYTARMDADDRAFPDRFEKQVRFLENNELYSVVGAGMMTFDETGITGTRIGKEFPQKKDLLYGVPHMHPTIMIRSDVLKKLGGYSTRKINVRCEDLELWYRFYGKGYVGYNLQEPLLYYREGIQDFKRRKFTDGVNISRTMVEGYQLLDFPKRYYPISLKPIISSIVPRKMLKRYHQAKDKGVI